MRVLVTGGLGFLGQQLARALLAAGELTSIDGQRLKISELVLLDMVVPAATPKFLQHPSVTIQKGSVADRDTAYQVVDGVDTVFHLAAVMSGQGEADFELCMSVNLDGTRNLLDACRAQKHTVKLVFASTCAVFGPQESVSDMDKPLPQTTYGMTKAMVEMMLNDYTRRGFVDARGARLPTVVVRPGKPNAATTSCYSGIVREPLNGVDVTISVDPDRPHACTSTRNVIESLLKLHDASKEAMAALGADRTVNLPSTSLSLRSLYDAAVKAAADPANKITKLGTVTWEIDTRLDGIVASMPRSTISDRAISLGLTPCPDADTAVAQYISDFVQSNEPASPAPLVGFVGLGYMGYGMAVNIARARRCLVYNRTLSKATSLVETVKAKSPDADVAVAETLQEVAAKCDVIAVCLADEAACRTTLLGDQGLVTLIQSRGVRVTVIDHSTVSVALSLECFAAYEAIGCDFLDAPISGGPSGAESGTLAVMVGGTPEGFERARPVFQCVGTNIEHMGAAGMGTVAKLANQLLVGIHATASCEALRIAKELGLSDFPKLLRLLNGAWGNSRILQRVGPLIHAAERGGGAKDLQQCAAPLRLLHKDLLLVAKAMETSTTSLSVTRAATGLFDKAMAEGFTEGDMALAFYLMDGQAK